MKHDPLKMTCISRIPLLPCNLRDGLQCSFVATTRLRYVLWLKMATCPESVIVLNFISWKRLQPCKEISSICKHHYFGIWLCIFCLIMHYNIFFTISIGQYSTRCNFRFICMSSYHVFGPPLKVFITN